MRKGICVFYCLLLTIFVYSQSIQPSGPTGFCPGEGVALKITGAKAGSTFQWLKDASPIAGATDASYVATAAATYSAIVTIGGKDTTINKVVVTEYTPPDISFSVDKDDACSGTPVKFTASSSSGTPPYTYEWDFGDGGSSTQQNPVHTYSSLGCDSKNFNVVLTVTDKNGCKTSVTNTVKVKQAPDVQIEDANFFDPFRNCENKPTQANPNYTLTINNISPSKACITSYSIDWGDGTPVQKNVTFPLTHTYTKLGAFGLIVTAQGMNGCSKSRTYTVANQSNPAGGLGTLGETTGLCAPATVPFIISNWEGNSPGTKYVLDFGDGKDTTLEHPLKSDTVYHTYTTTSCPTPTFTAHLNVVNACDQTPYSAGNIQIRIKPQALFSAPLKACVNKEVCFTNTTTLGYSGSDCNNRTVWAWDFGDGNPVDTRQTPCHAFTKPGTYTVTLTAGNLCGGSVSTTTYKQEICVTGPTTSVFTVDKKTGCPPFTVVATNASSTGQSCAEGTYKWTVNYIASNCGTGGTSDYFINGTKDTSANPVFLFTNPGTYRIALEVTNACGTTKSETEVIVKNPPTVTLQNVADVCAATTFTPAATVVNCGSDNLSYQWTFDDGRPATSTSVSPGPITFDKIGTNSLTLSVKNECGTKTDTKSFVIKPLPELTIPADQIVCAGSQAGTFTFTSTTTNASITWSATSNALSVGMNTTGGGATIPAFTAKNTTSNPIIVTITVKAEANGCEKVSSFTITVNPQPLPPSVNSVSYCKDETALPLSATAAEGYNLLWYTTPTGGTGSSTAPTPPTDKAGTTITYYVSQVNPATNCESSRTPMNVLIKPIPVISGSAVNPSSCASATGSIVLSGLSAGSFYAINYTRNGAPARVINQTAAGNGTLTISGLTAGTYNDITVTLDGCRSAAIGPFTLTDPSSPDKPTVSATSPVCSGSAINLKASDVPNAAYSWTGPDGYTSSVQNPSIVDATVAMTGIYFVTVTVAGCTSPPASVDVEVNQTPAQPVVKSNDPLCSDSTLFLTATSATSGVSYAWTGPNNFKSDLQNPSITGVTIAAGGLYSLTTMLGNCPSSPASVSVTVNPTPKITSASFTSPTTCGANNGSITLSGLGTGIYTVTYLKNGAPVTLPNQSVGANGTLVVNNLTAGTYSNIKVTANSCPSNEVGPFELKDPNPPTPPVVSSNSPVCVGGTISLSASSTTAGASYSWSGPGGFTNANASPVINNAGAANAGTYTVVATINGCSVSATTTVVVNPTPARPQVVSPVAYCQNEPALALQATGTNLTWYTKADTSDGSANAPVPSTSLSGTFNYFVLQANGFGCKSDTATIRVVVHPSIANNKIEKDQTICQGGSPQTLSPGATIGGGDGSYQYEWQISTDGGNVWTNINGAITTSLSPGPLTETTRYRRIVSSASCRDTSNVVIITVQATLTNVGIQSSQTICAGSRPDSLEGQVPTGGSGTFTYEWESSPDNTTWTKIAGATSQGYHPPVLTETIYYRRRVISGECSVYSPSVKISVNPIPQINAVPDYLYCNNATTAVAFSAAPSANVSYTWSNDNVLIGLAPNGSGNISAFTATNNSNPKVPRMANITVIPTYSGGGVDCKGPSTSFKIVVLPTVTISPIPDLAKCTGSAIAAYTPVADTAFFAGGSVSYSWTVSGSGIDLQNGSGNQIPGYSTFNGGTADVVATITVTPKYSYGGKTCDGTPVSYKVTVKPSTPSASAGPDAVLCADSVYTMKAAIVANTTGVWSLASGPSATIVTPTSPATQIKGLLPGNVYKFVWTQTGFADCPATTDTIIIDNKAPLQNKIDTATQTICAGQTTPVHGFAPSGGGGSFSFQWEQSSDGINYTPIDGETGQNIIIKPAGSVYLRRLVTALPCSNYSDTVHIIVQAAIASNTIAQDAAICTGTAAPVIKGSSPTGGDNQYRYSWEQSTNGGLSWTVINGATSQDLNPGVLTGTTQYRRTVQTTLCSGAFANTSNVVTITVNPDAEALFLPADTLNCPPFNLTPAVINLQPNAANGTYQWFADGKLIGTGASFPGYVISNENDSVTIMLKAISKFGCKDDSLSQKFYTYLLPHPSFTLSDTVGCGPLTIQATNLTPNLSSFTYFWDFGNGQTSTQANPSAVVLKPNPTYADTVYTVKLKVFSICDTLVVTKSVRVKSPPQALFTPVKTAGCSPMQAVFRNTSKGDHNTYFWDFGDGQTHTNTTLDSVVHTFNTGVVDTFYVKLKAVNECGVDSIRYAIVVAPNTIRLNFAVNGPELFGCTPHDVRFINNTSGASTFQWDFGDGNILSTRNGIDTVPHTYQSPGTYWVSLRAFNNCSDTTATTVITVYPKPKAAFTVNSNTVCIGDSVRFRNLSDSATSYLWQFGDANTSTLVQPTHKYKDAGLYTVKLTIFRNNPSGSVCTDTISQQVQVASTLLGTFTASDTVGQCAPLTVRLVNQNRPSVTAVWDFGDGTSGTGDSLVHTFNTFGTYPVKLTVTVPGGCTYVSSKTINVFGPGGKLIYTGGYNCFPNTVHLQVDAKNTDAFIWDLGDGKTKTTTDPELHYTYANPGSYLPSVKLVNNAGCTFPLQGVDTIKVDKITAGFSTSQQVLCGSTTISFSDTSRAFFGKALVKWVFGDGTFGNGFSATHEYTASGIYPVQMIVTGNSGCSDTVSKQLNVHVNSKPIAAINAVTAACTGKWITFKSSIQSTDAINITKWTVSNGATSDSPDFTYNFARAGTYTVQLVVGTVNGCYDTTTHTIQVSLSPVLTVSAGGALCLGNSMPLSASGAETYQWLPLRGLNCYTCANPIATPTITTPYIVEGKNSFGCVVYDTVVVTVIQPLKMVVSENDSICIGQSTNLLVRGGTSYNWSPAQGLNNTTISNPTASPTVTTTYRVVGYDGFNCFTDTAFVTVAVGQYPTVELGPDLTLAAGTQHQLVSTITNGPIRTWAWTPTTNLSCSNCAVPVADIKKDITYSVKVTTAYGCSASDTVSIKVFCESSQVFIPNAFTPDGDGINDLLMVRSKGVVTVRFFRIFNRWGNLVFEKSNFQPNNPLYGWDGKINGVVGGPDVFVYTCEVLCENGTSFTYKGNVSIIK